MSASDWRSRAERAPFDGAVVFHLAARVHEQGASEEAFLRDNAHKTRALAELAARGGARAFVFASSVKVNGEESTARPFTSRDPPDPRDAYARSKLAAEQALHEIARAAAMRVFIVRSPLVYGRGAAGNLRSLVRLADTPWPLPLAALGNRRSYLHVDDLANALAACARCEAGSPATFLVAHREPVSTARLVRTLRERLGRPARLFPVPAAVLEAGAALIGRGALARRLTRSLEVDPSQAEAALGWSAGVSLDRALADLVHGYREATP